MNNRKLLMVAATLLVVPLVVTGCSTPAPTATGSAEPIKIVIAPPTTGTFADFGADVIKGWEYAVDEANEAGGVDGHPVELIIKDTDGQIPTTVRAVTEAVTQDGAQFVSGIMTSPEHAAVFQQAEALGVVAINHIGQADNLTGESCAPNAFTTVQSTKVNIMAVASILDDIPGTKWAMLGADFSTGHDAAAAFKEAAEAVGDSVVYEQYAPLGTTDFGAYITAIKDSGADALFSTVYGADAVAFVNQADQFQLSESIESVLGLTMVNEALFETLGEKVVGYYGNVIYDVNADNPQNKAFVEGYTERYGEAPYYFPADAYIAAEALFAAIEEAGSIDPADVSVALEDLTFDSLHGTVSMRAADHRLLAPVYISQIEEGDSGLQWKTLTSVPVEDLSPEPSPDCKL